LKYEQKKKDKNKKICSNDEIVNDRNVRVETLYKPNSVKTMK